MFLVFSLFACADPVEACLAVGSTVDEGDPREIDARAACAAAGADGCEETWISEDTARCIAEADGLSQASEPWDVDLLWHHGLGTAVWEVWFTAQVEPEGWGARRVIDAADGTVLERGAWSTVQ